MFKILDRYIGKTVITATGVATAFITAVLFIMALLGEFKDIGEGDYGFGKKFGWCADKYGVSWQFLLSE